MPIIPIQAQGFSAHWNTVNSCQSINPSFHRLIWASVTAGYRPREVWEHGNYSVWDAISKFATLWSSLRIENNHLVKSSLFLALDPSEKGANSYRIGMMGAKLVASELLGIHWLLHVDTHRIALKIGRGTMRKANNAKTGTRAKGDFVGLGLQHRRWVAVEAKGRFNKLSQTELNKALNQVSTISTVRGRRVICHAVSAAQFNTNRLFIQFHDPPSRSNGPVVADAEIQMLFLEYYGQVVSVMSQCERIESDRDDHFSVIVPTTGVSLSLPLGIVNATQSGDGEALLRYLSDDTSRVHTLAAHTAEQGWHENPDGLFIRLDERWSDANMQREPSGRRND